jgi:hypothetical protein
MSDTLSEARYLIAILKQQAEELRRINSRQTIQESFRSLTAQEESSLAVQIGDLRFQLERLSDRLWG